MVVRRECVGTIQIQLIYSPISTWFPLINYLTNIYRGYLVGSTVRPYFKAFTVIFHKFGSIYWFFLIKNFLYVGIYHRLGGMSRLWHVPNRNVDVLISRMIWNIYSVHLFETSIWNLHLKHPSETSMVWGRNCDINWEKRLFRWKQITLFIIFDWYHFKKIRFKLQMRKLYKRNHS